MLCYSYAAHCDSYAAHLQNMQDPCVCSRDSSFELRCYKFSEPPHTPSASRPLAQGTAHRHSLVLAFTGAGSYGSQAFTGAGSYGSLLNTRTTVRGHTGGHTGAPAGPPAGGPSSMDLHRALHASRRPRASVCSLVNSRVSQQTQDAITAGILAHQSTC